MTGRPRNIERRQEQQQAFLAAFARTGVVTQAATAAGIVAPTHHKWMKDDAEYAERFAALKEQTADIAKSNYRKPGVPKGYVHPLGSKKGDRKHARQELFLSVLAKSGIIEDASRETGIPHESHVEWMRNDPDYVQRAQEVLNATADLRKERLVVRVSKASKARWADPGKRHQWSERQREVWNNPEKREKASRHTRQWMSDPEKKAAWQAANNSPMETEEGRARHSAMMREKWADPKYRDHQLEVARSDERRRKSSEGAKRQWARMSLEERREVMRRRRRVFKGGYRLTQIEATVIGTLGDLGIFYQIHQKVDGYVADILTYPGNLIIECDGTWFHDQRKDTDEIRDQRLAELGFRTLRLSEKEIKDGSFISKLQDILKMLALPRFGRWKGIIPRPRSRNRILKGDCVAIATQWVVVNSTVGTSSSSVYTTAAAAVSSYLRDLVINNSGAAPVSISFGTAATSAATASSFAVPAGGTVILTQCQVPNGSTIWGIAPAANSTISVGYATNVAYI